MDIIRITDLHDSRLEMYTELNEVQLKRFYEPAGGVFIAETELVISRALEKGCRPISFLVEEKCFESGMLDTLLKAAGPYPWYCDTDAAETFSKLPVFVAPLDVIHELTGYNLTRGVLCAMERPKPLEPEGLLEYGSRVCVLEDVMNPTNVGAIFRSAAALGIDAVLLTAACSDPLYRRAARVSMGTVFALPFAFFDKRTDYMAVLKKTGYTIVSMALTEDAIPLSSPLLKDHDRLAVIFGTESTGIKKETLAASDHIAIIPMWNGVDSLNVAAASAVTFWELCR
ncbi:MAG: RNA methyltransferase [Lachnospiraceae bacterium]|nr:RNA methyltransferase [Lachnospiraceae bacterium]